MNARKYVKCTIILLAIIIITIISTGCSEKKENKIIGSWRNQIETARETKFAIFISIHRGGAIVLETLNRNVALEGMKTINGKYHFEDDEHISVVWESGKMEVLSVKFPGKDRLILENIELIRMQDGIK